MTKKEAAAIAIKKLPGATQEDWAAEATNLCGDTVSVSTVRATLAEMPDAVKRGRGRPAGAKTGNDATPPKAVTHPGKVPTRQATPPKAAAHPDKLTEKSGGNTSGVRGLVTKSNGSSGESKPLLTRHMHDRNRVVDLLEWLKGMVGDRPDPRGLAILNEDVEEVLDELGSILNDE